VEKTNCKPDDILLFDDAGIVFNDVGHILAFLLNDNRLRQASVIPLEVTEAPSFTLHPRHSLVTTLSSSTNGREFVCLRIPGKKILLFKNLNFKFFFISERNP
jgi:hypothetical protein